MMTGKQSYYIEAADGTKDSIFGTVDHIMTEDGLKTELRYIFNIPNPFKAGNSFPEAFPYRREITEQDGDFRRLLVDLLREEMNRFASILNG